MNCDFVLTTCPYCGCGCQFYLQVVANRIERVIPCATHPVSEGKLCVKGWNAHEFVYNEGRLTKPLIKKNGIFEEASWDEALEYTAQNLLKIKENSGSKALGYLASAKCTNEENYLFMKFVRGVMGTNNVDHCARL